MDFKRKCGVKVFVSTCSIQINMPANQATLNRLEVVLARLETVAVKLGIDSPAKRGHTQSSADILSLVERLEAAADKIEEQSSGGVGSGKIVEFYDEFLGGKLKTFFKLSDELGGDVKSQVDLVKKLFQAQREFLGKASSTKMPPNDKIAAMIQPTVQLRQEVEAFRDRNRKSQFFNHLSAVSEGTEALLWVGAPGKPDIFVRDRKDGAVFYTNRVLKDFKQNPKHAEWAHSYIAALIELQQYCKEFHPTGVSWAAE
ncbi:unnamed protein product [Porites evermanni]|uniref:CAP N-terminal domain-containing protein n=1 Tax=Porites evermanni TaxID=104178 RepID=A0ABN8LSG2_9CNID|nr:unnamed protein product [Porites evermanni]